MPTPCPPPVPLPPRSIRAPRRVAARVVRAPGRAVRPLSAPPPDTLSVRALVAGLSLVVAHRPRSARLDLRVALYGGEPCAVCGGSGWCEQVDVTDTGFGALAEDRGAVECDSCDGAGVVPRRPDAAIEVAVTAFVDDEGGLFDGVPF